MVDGADAVGVHELGDDRVAQRDRAERQRALRDRRHDLIPGGAHTYSKGDDQYPVLAPGFIVRGHGCRVWDADDNEYVEYGMGLRSVTLGHAYAPVVEAAYRQMLLGENYTRPAAIEVACAERLLSMLGNGDMVKFAKNGSDATSAAVRLSRAVTGRDLVAICADHPFFSTGDWFIGTTPMSAGVPSAVQALTKGFRYNDIEHLRSLFASHPGQIACVVMEAETTEPPMPGYLHAVQDLCRAEGALFVLDEIITGFRWSTGGAQEVHDLDPDLSTFGKAMGNGFAVAALVGRREFMERGGLHSVGERVFLLSTTHGAENHSLAATMQVMTTYVEESVADDLAMQGERLRCGVERVVAEAGLENHVQLVGHPTNLTYVTRDAGGERSQAFRTLFMQELIRRGILGPSFVVSRVHDDAVVDRTIEAVSGALEVYGRALTDGVERHLVGRSVQPVMRPR